MTTDAFVGILVGWALGGALCVWVAVVVDEERQIATMAGLALILIAVLLFMDLAS